jgi:hypothetical protein
MIRQGPRADLSFFDGEPLLNLVGTALVDLSRRVMPGDPVYSHKVQSAYNHLVLRHLRQPGVEPAVSVAEMARWAATRPVHTWIPNLPEEYTDPERFLLDHETLAPTQLCLESSVPARDAAAEQFENLLMEEALESCRAMHSPEAYTAFRELLITKPVLTDREIVALSVDIELSGLHELIRRVYEPATAAHLRAGVFAECERCRCLLIPVSDGGYVCELDRCRRDGHARVGRFLDPHSNGAVSQLTRPLRMFITGPGLAEIDLRDALKRSPARLKAAMWPNFDAYDLRIVFADGQVWAIDVKDRVNPARLGSSTKPFRAEPRFDRALLVVPQYRFDEHEAYGRIFAKHLPEELDGQVELLSDTEVLRQARAKAARIRKSRVSGAVQGEVVADA